MKYRSLIVFSALLLPSLAYVHEKPAHKTTSKAQVKEAPVIAPSSKDLVTGFLNSFVENKELELDQYLAKNYQVSNTADLYDSNFVRFSEMSKNFKVRAKSLQSALPDMELKIHEIVAEGDKVSVAYSMSGIQKGAFFGIMPTNKLLVIKVFATFTIQQNKITHVAEMWNELSLMKQIGDIVL